MGNHNSATIHGLSMGGERAAKDLEINEQLDWHSRMAIACRCVQGLMYLHHDADFELVHGNIKSTNVLLGPTFAPKIIDFGSSRLLNDSVARAKCVFGYAPPEDTKGETFTKGNDVFSLGILLLELINGKNPSKKIQKETDKLSIVEWHKIW
ncbi:hypothetical protein L7F22_030693 [Adiantum nelumboides]|nr:hypothetical protein [Adiantum nelumboides]